MSDISQTSAPDVPKPAAGARPKRPWLGPLISLVLVYGLFVALRPDTFARSTNLVTMARQTVVVGIAASGMTLVIAMGGIDLSIGSGVALTTVVLALLLKSGFGALTAVLGAIVALTIVGLLTGLLVTGLRVTPFIITLGGMSILRGVAKGLAHEQKIDVDARGLDALVASLPTGWGWLLVPPGVWLLGLVALLTAGLLHATRLGRYVLAIGSNERTALLCGVDVKRVKITVYALAAALAGLAGVIEFSTLTVGDPTDSVGLELDVIAAVIIGGGSLSGGEGSVTGSVLGALLLTVIKTGCTHVGLPNWVQHLVTGAIIVIAVVADRFRKQRRSSG